MKLSAPIEKKTAYSTSAGGLVTFVLVLNGWQHWFTPPPPDVTAAIVAFLSGVAGYFAPHTPRPAEAPVVVPPVPATPVTLTAVTSGQSAAGSGFIPPATGPLPDPPSPPTPSLIVKVDGNLTPEAAEQIKAAVAEANAVGGEAS